MVNPYISMCFLIIHMNSSGVVSGFFIIVWAPKFESYYDFPHVYHKTQACYSKVNRPNNTSHMNMTRCESPHCI